MDLLTKIAEVKGLVSASEHGLRVGEEELVDRDEVLAAMGSDAKE